LRRLLFEVRTPALEVPGGFLETIGERMRMLKSLTAAEVETDIDLPDELSYEFRSMLFRQLTEAIANVEKHASATRVRVLLRVEEGGMYGLVEDDGRGFVVAERDHLPGHLGLLALNERALLAGGWNKIRSEPGLGTTVEFWLPLAENEVQMVSTPATRVLIVEDRQVVAEGLAARRRRLWTRSAQWPTAAPSSRPARSRSCCTRGARWSRSSSG